MDTSLFEGTLVESERILYTPSTFARTNLIHLQECGRLKALSPHTSHRENLASYLCFIVLEGSGTLEYDQKHYTLLFSLNVVRNDISRIHKDRYVCNGCLIFS